ncbi:MAG: hypothetical protein IJR42_01325 [Paludibacteraceae bacterium]|nr:hypothetical protein [Paludibacteraceae bacterium]
MPENDIIIKITGEADLDAAQKQLQELTKRSEDYEKQIEKLKEKEKQVSASLRQSIKNRKELSDVLIETHRQYSNQRKALKDNITANKQSIKALTDQVKAYKTLHGQSGRMVQQLRAMREELQRMEDAGEFGSQAFVDLAIAAGKLEDQIGDTQQRIRILASDTKNMDALMGLGDGLAGTFYIATSGAELFGEDMEGLQQAFYKVQAAMSILSGTQQIYNSLQKDSAFAVVFGNGLEKTKQKLLQRSTALERLYNIQKKTGAATNSAQAFTTGLWTKAQWKLNAAIAANPIGATIMALLALGAAVMGIISAYNKFVSTSGKAQMKLEELRAQNGANEAKRAHDHERRIQSIDNKETKALAEAKKRYASEVEMAKIKAKNAKERAKETEAYTKKEIALNNQEVEQLKIIMEESQKEADSAWRWFGRKKRKQKEAAEAQQNYYEALRKTEDLEQQNIDTQQAASDAEQELVEARKSMTLEAEQTNINIMRDGATKEIALINANYREKLKYIKGNTKEEIALRKALEDQQAKEISEVRKKYSLQALQVEVQEKKNLLTAMAQSRGTEADYEKELELTKEVAKKEAKARIDSLDKVNMSTKEYAAQKAAIELELAETIKRIDNDEATRKAENARRITEIELREAEIRKNALTGAEGVDEQKAILEDYYATRKKQLEENARLEKESVERSKDTEEVKTAKIKAIDAQLNADLVELKKEGSQAMLDVDKQYLTELEIAADKAADKVSKAGTTGDKLKALKEQFEAEKALNAEQIKQLDEAWNSGALTDHSEYLKERYELTKATVDAELEYQQNAIQAIADGFDQTLSYIQQISDIAFEALSSNVQAELDAFEKMYTTDWEEAQKNADKKYLTEKAYEKKKAALQEKQAKYAKAQAIINAGINTALAITNALSTWPVSLGIAMAAIVGAMGAIQIGVIANKPLAQYAKGRKGGKGEYALVGEKGPEVMYVPDGASIVPNSLIATPEAWPKFGVPELPHTDREIMRYAAEQTAFGASIDYDRMGASVAEHLPKQRNVTVNVDRSGVHILDGGNNRTYLNAKYNGSWS